MTSVDKDELSPSSSMRDDAAAGWEPDSFLGPYAAENFEVEQHATQILQAGNINEEVGEHLSFAFIKFILQSRVTAPGGAILLAAAPATATNIEHLKNAIHLIIYNLILHIRELGTNLPILDHENVLKYLI